MELISQLCVLTLLRNTKDCSPDYIQEKMAYLNSEPQTAFAALDLGNQHRVMDYLVYWNQEIPDWMLKNV